MSLQAAAQHLASKGRGPDTMLIHVAPTEVAGLQALAKAHGGTLTTNPDTGLPEAGFLSNLLPMVIGAGITAATGGAAAPWMVGLGMGGLETLRTGNLGKGLMAGLGAYGGAGLAGGLMGAGASGMGQAAAQGVMEANPQLAASEIGREMGQAGFVQPQLAASANPATATAFDKMQAGLSNLGALNKMEMARYGLAAAAPMMTPPQTTTKAPSSGPNPYRYRYELENPPQAPFTDSSREARQMIGTYVPYAAGGTVQNMSDYNEQMAMLANGGQGFATGGETHLGDYSDGGRLLKGPGDGVSDSIPATIADKRPARLADGVFVVPARIVSELGNGSTDAGARKLYAMMDRVQKARAKTTGKDRVAVNSRADKALPA